MSLIESLLGRLGDGRARLPEELCQALNASPDDLASACEELKAMGLTFRTCTADCLQLEAPLDWLQPEPLQATAMRLELELDIHLICPSTNAVLAASLEQRRLPAALIAEGQSGGRGRRGRSWSSPPGGGIYLSVAWRCPRSPAELAPLGLIGGMAAARALNRFDLPPVRVKWPNDLQVAGRKIGGCLVEVSGPGDGPSDIVIGLGVNVRLPANLPIDQPWADLHSLGCRTDRSQLACVLLEDLVAALRVVDEQGVAPLLADWAELDALADQRVEVCREDGLQLQGQASGIDPIGRLRLKTSTGEVCIHSGEVRVRAV